MAYRWATKLVTQRQLWPTFSGEKNFSTTTISQTFVEARRKLAVLWVWPILLPEFRELWSGGQASIDMHQSFTDTLKWFFDNKIVVRTDIPTWIVAYPTLLWPNSWMDEDATWYGSRPLRRPHCIRQVPSAPRKAHSIPLLDPCLLWPRSPISAAAELMLVLLSGDNK